MMASNYNQLISLSAEERELFELLLAKEGLDATILPIRLREPGDVRSLSFSQERFWFLHQMEPESPAYNVPLAFRLRGMLNATALEQALNELARRHEVLRTSFPAIDGQPTPRVAAEYKLPLHRVDLTNLIHSEQETELSRFVAEEARITFGFAASPLFRASLVSLSAEEQVLLIVTHHLVVDGWSLIVLMQELGELYDACRRGTDANLPKQALQYSDFASWQRERVEKHALDEQLQYWKRQLEGATFVLDLPTDRIRPAVESHSGASLTFAFPTELTSEIREFSRREGVTLYMVLLATFQTMLHRYTGQDDLIVGTAISERSRPEIERVIGPFSNSLLMRTNFADNPSFRELLTRVAEMSIEAFAHQELPLEKLIEELRPNRDLSRNPLFQVMFVLHQAALDRSLALGDVSVTQLPVDIETSRFDLTFDITDDNGTQLFGHIEYNTDLFDRETIKRLSQLYETCLRAAIANPGRRISELDFLSTTERRRMLDEWNQTEQIFDGPRTVHELFEAQAAKSPHSVAVVFKGERVTYAELNSFANKLSGFLRSRGVRRGDRVAVMLDRSWQMVVALLGIMKAGAAYVPLDSAHPRDRLAMMLDDSQPSILITESVLEASIPRTSARIVRVDTDRDVIARERGDNLAPVSGGEDIAYVIYTSGSTGGPKGVQIPHRAVVNFLLGMCHEPGISAGDKLLAVTTLTFDIAGLEIFLPLVSGATVEIVSRDVAIDGRQLREHLVRADPIIMQATPATWRMLIEAGWTGSPRLKLLCGGEALPRELAAELLKRCASLWNLYGPTETTVWSTLCQITRVDTSITIGRPIANTQVYLLDKHLKPVPLGAPGEIYIGGAGLARGYLNRPELTAAKFIRLSFERSPEIRLYKTGDLARYLPDGQIEYLGRLDNQIKVRGYRIEPGEIEAELEAHPGVQEAVVIRRDDPSQTGQLITFLVPRQNAGFSTEELQNYLKRALPDYMIPALFVPMDALPLTPNGKVDRLALTRLGENYGDPPKLSERPRDEIERRLATLWEGVLRKTPIGVRDNFFQLGGHSLLAVRLFAGIESEFNRTLPLATLFRAPTIAELANLLRQEERPPAWSSLVAIQADGSNLPFFAIHAAGGNVLFYRDLARRLGSDQPFYGVQALGLDGKQPRHRSVEEMAAHYIGEIKALQPEGPYFLGGSSFGGVIAYEMAQQLFSQGQRVAMLAMFDTYGPGYPKLRPETTVFRFKLGQVLLNMRHHIDSLIRLRGAQHKLGYLYTKSRKALRLVKKGAKAGVGRIGRHLFVTFGRKLPETLRKVEECNQKAILNYIPQPYFGSMTIFRATNQPGGIYTDDSLGWGEFVRGKIEIHEVQGTHSGIILEPWVECTAEKIRASLEKARESLTRDVEISRDFGLEESWSSQVAEPVTV